MKRIFIILLVLGSMGAAAQVGPNFYIRNLNMMGQAVSLDLNVATAVNAYVVPSKIMGYRVCVFSDNSQSARGAAAGALSVVHSVAAGVSANMIYDNPFFRVYAGYCTSKIEATILLGRLKYSFPKAFIVPFAISPSDLSPVVSITSDDPNKSAEQVVEQ